MIGQFINLVNVAAASGGKVFLEIGDGEQRWGATDAIWNDGNCLLIEHDGDQIGAEAMEASELARYFDVRIPSFIDIFVWDRNSGLHYRNEFARAYLDDFSNIVIVSQ